MAETETLVYRASLKPKIYRDFEFSAANSLYTLAQAIVSFFDFDFDDSLGFYSNLHPPSIPIPKMSSMRPAVEGLSDPP